MEIVQRIKKLIEEKYGVRGTTSFAKAIGVEQVTLSRQLNGQRGLSFDVIEAILKAFPDVSAEWLIRGEEQKSKPIRMIKPGKLLRLKGVGTDTKICDIVDSETRPRIPVKASAGSLTTMVDGITEIQCEQFPVVHNFPKYDFTIHISGDSMVPYYISGDEVACLRITSATFIQWGRVHVLDTSQGIVIKRIYDNGDTIRCVSYNPDYPDFNVPKDEIFSYNLVVGTLRL